MEPWQQAFNPFIASSLAYTTFFLRCVSVEEEGTLFFVDNSTETLLRDQLSMLPPFEASYVHIRASHFGSSLFAAVAPATLQRYLSMVC